MSCCPLALARAFAYALTQAILAQATLAQAALAYALIKATLAQAALAPDILAQLLDRRGARVECRRDPAATEDQNVIAAIKQLVQVGRCEDDSRPVASPF